MQLDQFYLSIIQMTLIDAIAIGTGAGMLVATFFGIRLKRQEVGGFSWLLGGTVGIAVGTIFGYFIMNTVGSIVAWSGSPIQGLAGVDLAEWTDTIAALFAPVQMQAAGFALMGALLGIGWGYGIGSQPDDNSKLGNIISTLGVIAVVMGLLFTILPAFVTFSVDVAFYYFILLNGIILLCYGVINLGNRWGYDTPPTLAVIGLFDLFILVILIPYFVPVSIATFFGAVLVALFFLLIQRILYLNRHGPVAPSTESEEPAVEELIE